MMWRDAFYRMVRTFLQAFLGVFLALSVTSGIDQVPDVNSLKRVALAALWAGFVAGISGLQNFLEDNQGLPALLKKAPPPTDG